MKEKYYANDLYVGRLFYVSSMATAFGPMCCTTELKYIFEKVNGVQKGQIFGDKKGNVNGKYHEIFTDYEF
jgi:hypothetical protein